MFEDLINTKLWYIRTKNAIKHKEREEGDTDVM